MRVHIEDINLYTLICDNDQVLLNEDEEYANLLVRNLLEEYAFWRLEIYQ